MNNLKYINSTYCVKDNYVYLHGYRKEKHEYPNEFFWRFKKINKANGYTIFYNLIRNIMTYGKIDESLPQKYDDIKNTSSHLHNRHLYGENAVRIREEFKNGSTMQSLVDKYGGNIHSMENLLTGKTYKTYGGPIKQDGLDYRNPNNRKVFTYANGKEISIPQ
jgi:hypothetical protein